MALPGSKSKDKIIKSMLMVNHAGEYGAKRIYQGQLDYVKDQEAKEKISHMAEQEDVHLQYFSQELIKRRYRPTMLVPIWHCFGHTLGAVTASLGASAAMACTQAVEEVIDRHYQSQLDWLQENGGEEEDLRKNIEQFKQEELEHRDIAISHINKSSNGFRHKLLKKIIGGFCQLAISLSKRI